MYVAYKKHYHGEISPPSSSVEYRSGVTRMRNPVLQDLVALTFMMNSKLKSDNGLYMPFLITPNV